MAVRVAVFRMAVDRSCLVLQLRRRRAPSSLNSAALLANPLPADPARSLCSESEFEGLANKDDATECEKVVEIWR